MIRAPAFAAMLLALCAIGRADVTVRAEATPDSLTIAQTITLTLTATTPAGWILDAPVPPVTPDGALGPFTITSVDRTTPTLTADGRMRTTYTIALAPGLPGPAAIPPITFTARQADSLATESATTSAIPITIRSVLDGLTADSFTPGEIRPPLVPRAPTDSTPLVTGLIGGGIGAAVAIAAMMLRKRIRRRPRSALDACRDELDALTRFSGPTSDLARTTSESVRTALAETIDPRFRSCAAGAETEILLKAMPALPPDHRLTIATFLADAERLACSPASGPDEAARLVDAGRACLAIASTADAREGGRR